jgi:hypothetical protein
VRRLHPRFCDVRAGGIRPARLIIPMRCFPPVECSFVVGPTQAAGWRPASSTAVVISIAWRQPDDRTAPGTVARRVPTALALGAVSSLTSICLARLLRARNSRHGHTCVCHSIGWIERRQGLPVVGSRGCLRSLRRANHQTSRFRVPPNGSVTHLLTPGSPRVCTPSCPGMPHQRVNRPTTRPFDRSAAGKRR